MSISPFDSFQSRFVTYLLNRPRTSVIRTTARVGNMETNLMPPTVVKTPLQHR